MMCNCCGRVFPCPRALRRHSRYCRPRPGLAADLSGSPGITVDVPEAATHREAGSQTEPDYQLPLDAIPPSRRISRAHRQLIRPLLEEAIGGQTDIGVDTRSRPSTSHCCVLSMPQVPDRHPAPNREVAYVQECILARPELVGRLCRCRTCVQHSTLARRRMGAQSTTRPPPLCFVSLPIQRELSSNFGERQILRQLQSTTPSSVVCLCTCYVCVGHRTLDFAAESLVRRASPSPPEGGGCRDQRDQRDCTTTH